MAVPQQQSQLPIGQLLVSKGVISEDQLRIAVQEQHKNHQPIGSLLVRLGFLSEATIRDVLSENLGKESVDLTTVIIDSAAIALIPKDVARRYQLLPLSVDAATNHLILAVADPNNILALDQVRAMLHGKYQLTTQVASESDIVRAIDQYYGLVLHIAGFDFVQDAVNREFKTIVLVDRANDIGLAGYLCGQLIFAMQQGAHLIECENIVRVCNGEYQMVGGNVNRQGE